jgi:virginiamycin A acetyltransferase
VPFIEWSDIARWPSTFPFPIMGGSWAEHADLLTVLTNPGNTVIGHDVWIGYHVLVMPGVRVGDGAIIASGSVVVNEVPDYGIVGGNPARLIRKRFTDEEIARLLALAWWDWSVEHISAHVRALMVGSVEELERVAPTVR